MMKRNMITMLVLTTLIPGWTARAVTDAQKACINNLRILEAATDQAVIEGNLAEGAVIPVNVISGYLRGGIASIKCPAKGVYTFGTVDEEPFCSIHGTMDGVMKGGGGVGTKELLGREPETEDEIAMDEVVGMMSRDQGDFDPAVLKNKGVEGMRELADRLFPQTAAMEGSIPSRKEFEQLMTKLGAGNYKEREDAERRLSMDGGIYWRELESATRSSDPEVTNRANSILKTVNARNEKLSRVDYAQYIEAFKVYLAQIEDVEVLNELQLRAKGAKDAVATNGGQIELIDVCLDAEIK